ncbi:response regulator [Hydrogenophaga sp. RAC07]|nr:response regulator [Hydrogenophaga sp. RAC07]
MGRVLLVEDDEVQREGMAQWLRDDGLVVDECSTVEQAVARYQGQEFDVVVTDLRLEGSSGLELIRQIRKMDDCASAVVVTQFADMAAATAALRGGAVDFVAKPLMPDELRVAVQRAMGYRALSKKNEQLQLALKTQNVQLQQTNELLQAFAGRVAHDLRAPVRSSRLWAQFAAEALQSGEVEQVGQYLNSTIKSLSTGTAIIDGLLAFSKSDSLQLQLEEFSLSDEVETIVESCRLEFRDRAFDVSTKVEGTVTGDPVLLGIAITNLIHNAFKYSSQQNAPRVNIVAGPIGLTYRITVQDNGIGIDPSQTGQLFDPFVRLETARQFSGEGLGLTTVKKIIERHGGTVCLESSVGNGATAIIDLPVVHPGSHEQPAAMQNKENT